MSRGKTGGAGTPVPSIARETAGTTPAPCTTRKINFAEALAMGMPPREALGKSDPAKMKDITIKGLQACIDAGLTRDEMAKGFGITKSTLGWQACQMKFKFPKGYHGFTPEGGGVTPEKTTPKDVQGGGTDVQPDVQPLAAGGIVTGPAIAFVGEPAAQEPIAPIVAANKEAAAHTPTPAELAEVFRAGGPAVGGVFNVTIHNIADVSPTDYSPDIEKALRTAHGCPRPRKVYIAHPLRGAGLQDNIAKVTEICLQYAERRDVIPFSPVHAFGFLDPMTYDQVHGMAMCFALLASCDELWVHGPWWTSEGCLAEICFAITRGIPVRFVTLHPVVEGRQLA